MATHRETTRGTLTRADLRRIDRCDRGGKAMGRTRSRHLGFDISDCSLASDDDNDDNDVLHSEHGT